ncbi:Uncharacterized protein dnm_088540 [Desulfonema magnum]|uniref:Uncharacterized protein n=1 Tax=Desulfonema magnum TaxID=45655 RepID=A0A975BW17_9BACT|nr:Uncharacterized protein dnm_088540 [Desulfonema magnum]
MPYLNYLRFIGIYITKALLKQHVFSSRSDNLIFLICAHFQIDKNC